MDKKKKYFINHYKTPNMLFADKNGNIYDHPDYLMVGMSFDECVVPSPDELIDIPKHSKLFFLPETKPIGFDPLSGEFVVVETMFIDNEEIECFAVSVFLEPGYVRNYLPGADYTDKSITLPLWSYTGVGIDEDGNIKVCAFSIEKNSKWDPENYDDKKLIPKIKELEKKFTENRLMNHLKRCAKEYHCFAAKNLFLTRWEAPLPISRTCNANCLGCLSKQDVKGPCASHERISFKPNVKEIVELAVRHLENADEPMVSFGQGCEGEPLTESELIISSIKEIRKKTNKGTINLNTNGSMPQKLIKIIEAGLNSVRISMNSVIPRLYNAYFKPINYSFIDVIKSVKISKENNIYTMINYLIFPGVNDTEEEYEALRNFIIDTKVDFIHFKNLCIDPSDYILFVGKGEGKQLGIRGIFELLKSEFSELEIGYFNRNVINYIGYA